MGGIRSAGPRRLIPRSTVDAFIHAVDHQRPAPPSFHELRRRILAGANKETAPLLEHFMEKYRDDSRKLELVARLAATRGFKTLNRRHLQLLLDKTLGGGPVTKLSLQMARMYEKILNDVPFTYQTDAQKMVILDNPRKYVKLTQEAMFKFQKERYLPSDEEFERYVRHYLATHPNKPIYTFKVEVLRNYRRYFLENWYFPARGGRTVGDQFATLNGWTWRDAIFRAHGKYSATTTVCTMDNMNHDFCPAPEYMP